MHEEIPFCEHTAMGAALAVSKGERPPIRLAHERASVGSLIRDCWAQDAQSRPAVSEVVQRLLQLEATHGAPVRSERVPTHWTLADVSSTPEQGFGFTVGRQDGWEGSNQPRAHHQDWWCLRL